jgi:hypothetical protein
MALIRFILILIFLYYFFRVITRFLLPFLAQRFVRKAQENFNRQQAYADPEEARKREGEVNVKAKPQDKSNGHNAKDKLGDYVDFEEIKEDK